MSDSKAFFGQFLALHKTLVNQDKTIVFDSRWKNGTGYLDGAVRTVHLEDGQLAAFTDDAKRRGVIVGTPAGNVVLFERYSSWSSTDTPEVLVSNHPVALRQMLPGCSSSWTKTTWEACFPELSVDADGVAKWTDINIGTAVAAIGKAIQTRTAWTINPNKKA